MYTHQPEVTARAVVEVAATQGRDNLSSWVVDSYRDGKEQSACRRTNHSAAKTEHQSAVQRTSLYFIVVATHCERQELHDSVPKNAMSMQVWTFVLSES
jgi:hypothetical protein